MTLDGFNSLILPKVMGCPLPEVRLSVLQAARELCKKAFVWNAFQDPVSLQEGVASYNLVPVTDAYIHTVKNIWMGARELTPASMEDVAALYPNWQVATSNEPTMYNLAEDRTKVRVFPIPTGLTAATPQVRIRSIFVPLNTAQTLPDFMGRDYDELISWGALARLLMPTNTEWSNPNLGAYYEAKFSEGVVSARIDEEHDRVQSSITVAPRSFGF